MIISCLFVFSILFSKLFSMLLYSTKDRVHLCNKKRLPFTFLKQHWFSFPGMWQRHTFPGMWNHPKRSYILIKILHYIASQVTNFFFIFMWIQKMIIQFFFFVFSNFENCWNCKNFHKSHIPVFVESSTITKRYSLLTTFPILRNYLLVTWR